MGIDLNRGVVIRHSPEGMRVHMYKDEPGTYRDAYGNEVSEKLARTVGFDVTELAKLKRKGEKLAAAHAQIEEEEGNGDAKGTVVEERGGYRVEHMGFGHHFVFDADDNQLTPQSLTKKKALALLDTLAA